MPIPADYEERVYAGVLGKIIGVYLGRPFEGWRNDRIEAELGEINYYVHERLGKPLVVADDDISGTFTFVRALEDHGVSAAITAEQIGQTWRNYLIEERTILWWGGMGHSTEHTAFLRLKQGIAAPASGSIEVNTREVAEQIGAQIFIDSWAMVAPGEPELAAALARKAGSVSHDGEAIYGAQVVAAMEAAAFFEGDMDKLLDIGLAQIPDDCIIARLIGDLRRWHGQDGDWRQTFGRVQQHYGYDTYGGNCHMVPNHAVIILALLYGDSDFQKSQVIANTAGWDTDCNAGNVGCLLGIKEGLAGLATGPDWRGPVADRLFNISADGGGALTDAVRETYRLCRVGRQLLGAPPPPPPPARYHFSLPGSVQGFVASSAPDSVGSTRVNNVADGVGPGSRSLAVHFEQIAPGRPGRAGVQTFGEPANFNTPGYSMVMSASVYSGQTVTAPVRLDQQTGGPVSVALFMEVFPQGPGQTTTICYAPFQLLAPGSPATLNWQLPDTGGLPIVRIGVECRADRGTSGTLFVDHVDWAGAPSCVFSGAGLAQYQRPMGWTDGIDNAQLLPGGAGVRFRLIHNEGRGLLINGTHDWTDYCLRARVTPHMAAEAGIAARVGGMRRFYALLLCHGQRLRLLRCCEGGEQILAEADFAWAPNEGYDLSLSVVGSQLVAVADGREMFSLEDTQLSTGAIALVQTEGHSYFSDVSLEAIRA
ncbi:MAG: ADP-ribosylglycohydrolase family protein [bacterium]|nr:ADP-ribosylglycohydrolase family protein [bacterium]